MLRLLRQISLPQLRASWGRTALVVGGIATGVTLIVAINVINTSVLANLERTIALVAGPAEIQVTLGVGEVGFSEHVVALVRDDPDVAGAVPMVRGTLVTVDEPRVALQLFGVDLVAEQDLARYTVARVTERREILRGMADPRSILLTETVAARLGLAVGDAVSLSAPSGVAAFTVRGLLAPEGLAKAFAGNLAIMDLAAAQAALGRPDRIDQIDLILRDGAVVDTVRDRLATRVPSPLEVGRPAQRGTRYETVLASFQALLAGLSLLCLVAGVYIIYNTTSTGATHRALALASLRVTGAESGQLFMLLMLEALALGAVGSGIGIVNGLILARLLIALVTDAMGVIFQLRFPTEGLAIAPLAQLGIGILGIGATMFASFFAARRVARMDPLLRLHSIAWGNAGSTLWNVSMLIIAIPIVSWSARILARGIPRWFGPEGRVAAESLFRSTVRTAVTAGAVGMVFGIGITIATLARSHRASVGHYVSSGFLASDLLVSAVATEGGWLESPLPESAAAAVASVPGVRTVELIRIMPGQE